MITLVSLECDQFKSLRDVALSFPQRGGVLIEGHNEAGKSTLFEAVYFGLYGRPLVGDVLAHGASVAFVRLVVMVDDVRLTIERWVRRTAADGFQPRVRLTVEQPGTELEVISTIRAANNRIIYALGGLDGDALLNSCFVEQKKLDRLEQLGGQTLVASLLKLLNLEKLTNLQREFRFTTQDLEAIGHLRKRKELAEVVVTIPPLLAERQEIERTMRVIVLRRYAEQAQALDQERRQFGEARVAVQEGIERLQAHLDRYDAMHQVSAEAERAIGACDEIDDRVRACADLAAQIASLDEREQSELPRRVAAVERLEALDDRVKEAEVCRQRAEAAARDARVADDALADYLADQDEHADLLSRGQDAEAQLAQLREQLAALDTIKREALPAARSRVEALTSASASLAMIAALQEEAQRQRSALQAIDGRLVTAAQVRTRIEELSAQSSSLDEKKRCAEGQAADANRIVRTQTLARLYRDWARLKGAAEAIEHGERLLVDARGALATAQRALGTAADRQRSIQQRLLASLAGVGIGLLLLLAGVAGIGATALVIGLVLAVGASAIALSAVRARSIHRTDVSHLDETVHAADREVHAAELRLELRAGGSAVGSSQPDALSLQAVADVGAVEVQLRELGGTVPASMPEAASLASSCDTVLARETSLDTAAATLGVAQERVGDLVQQLAGVDGERRAALAQLHDLDPDGARSARAAVEQTLAAVQPALEHERQLVLSSLIPLNVPPEPEQVAQQLGAAHQHRDSLAAELARRDSLIRRCDEADDAQRLLAERAAGVAARLGGANEADLRRAAERASANAKVLQDAAADVRARLEQECAAAGVGANAAGQALGGARTELRDLRVALDGRPVLRERLDARTQDMHRRLARLLDYTITIAARLRRLPATSDMLDLFARLDKDAGARLSPELRPLLLTH